MSRGDLRETLAQRGEMTDEIGKVLAFHPRVRPVGPADLVVLAIGVVVTALAVADFISCQNQRHSLSEQQGCQLVLSKLSPQGENRRVFGRAFVTAVNAEIYT